MASSPDSKDDCETAKLNRVIDAFDKWYAGVSSYENRIKILETDVAWLKRLYKSLDYRVWFIVTGIILMILIQVARI